MLVVSWLRSRFLKIQYQCLHIFYCYRNFTLFYILDAKTFCRTLFNFPILCQCRKKEIFSSIFVACDEKLSIFYLHFNRCTAYATPYYLHFILFCISELLNLGKGIKVKSRIKLRVLNKILRCPHLFLKVFCYFVWIPLMKHNMFDAFAKVVRGITLFYV